MQHVDDRGWAGWAGLQPDLKPGAHCGSIGKEKFYRDGQAEPESPTLLGGAELTDAV
jgi:hypothetical protein